MLTFSKLAITAFGRAIKIAGGQTALAKLIGVKHHNLWYWFRVQGRLPAEHVLKVETATSGKVSRHDLRRDLYPMPIKKRVRK